MIMNETTTVPPAVSAADSVCAVILSYNSLESLKRVVAAVRRQTHQVNRIFIVDNGSTDGTKEWCLESCGGCELILLSVNNGVGAGHNRGWEAAIETVSPQFIWALEHDSVPEPRCLDALVQSYRAYVKKQPIGAVSPNTVPSHIDPAKSCKRIFWRLWRVRTTVSPSRDADRSVVRNFLFNGTLFPTTTLREIGYLNEQFHVGYEDFEFADRVRRAGKAILFVPAAVVAHDDFKAYRARTVLGREELFATDSVSRSYYARRNALYLERCRKGLIPTLAKVCVKLPLIVVNTLLERDEKLRRVQGDWFAVRDGMRGYLGPRSYRFLRS